MKEHRNLAHGLIEYILSALDAPEQDSRELWASDGVEPNPAALDDTNIQAAREVKKFMDEMPGGFFMYQAGGDEELIYANKAMIRLFNCESMAELRQLTGNSFRGIVHPEDLDAVEESIRLQISQSRHDLDYVEYRIIQKGGGIRWIEDYGHFVQSEYMGGIFYVFVGDATEKKERQLEERLQRLEVIEGLSINYESILYANLDTDQVVPYRLSSKTEPMFDSKPAPYSFRWFTDSYDKTWVYPEDRKRVHEATDPEYIRERLSQSSTYYVNYRTLKDNEIQYLQLRIVNVSSQEHISRIVLGYRRVDDEVRYEMEQKKILEDALNHAKLANIAKDTFLSNMSHDMRTPLNAITGYTALARNHIQNPALAEEYLNKIETSGTQLLGLINNVLEISRLESGTIQNEESECCLPSLVENLKLSLLPTAKAKHISFSTDLSCLEHCDIYCDSTMLERILGCLLGNAIKYTSNGGQVRLSVEEQTAAENNYGTYSFIVEDNGIGISSEYLSRIFAPFERVENTTQSGIPGTGLGLTIAKNMAEMMGGTIQVQSTPKKGSRFTVTFQFRLKNQQFSTSDSLEQTVLKLVGQRKLLLVDDNEINVEIESELLEDIGFSVETAENGRIALETIQSAPSDTYALILMDIQMPVMNGYEATQAIRSLPDPERSGIPIIALSSNAFEEDRRMSRESGMNAHMAKPANIEELMELMANALRFK